MLVISTPESVNSPWVNFESGGAWISETRVIPCCIKGMTEAKLPAPLRDLQAIDLGSLEHLEILVETIAKTTKIPQKSRINYENALEVFQNAVVLTKKMDENKNTLAPKTEALTILEELEVRLKADVYDIGEELRKPKKGITLEDFHYESYLEDAQLERLSDIEAIRRVLALLEKL